MKNRTILITSGVRQFVQVRVWLECFYRLISPIVNLLLLKIDKTKLSVVSNKLYFPSQICSFRHISIISIVIVALIYKIVRSFTVVAAFTVIKSENILAFNPIMHEPLKLIGLPRNFVRNLPMGLTYSKYHHFHSEPYNSFDKKMSSLMNIMHIGKKLILGGWKQHFS